MLYLLYALLIEKRKTPVTSGKQHMRAEIFFPEEHIKSIAIIGVTVEANGLPTVGKGRK